MTTIPLTFEAFTECCLTLIRAGIEPVSAEFDARRGIHRGHGRACIVLYDLADLCAAALVLGTEDEWEQTKDAQPSVWSPVEVSGFTLCHAGEDSTQHPEQVA